MNFKTECNITEIRPYKPTELAAMYNVSSRTFIKWLKPFQEKIGQKNGWYFSVLQVETIIACLGMPNNVIDTN
jgi:hypothetical protein